MELIVEIALNETDSSACHDLIRQMCDLLNTHDAVDNYDVKHVVTSLMQSKSVERMPD